jgi:hypothetical protein
MKKLLKVAIVVLAVCTMLVACVSKPVAGTEGAWKLCGIGASFNGWDASQLLVDNKCSFVATGTDEFKFTDGTWSLTAVCEPIAELGTEYALEGFGDTGFTNITFDAGVLTPGVEYEIELIVEAEDVAYVVVTEK